VTILSGQSLASTGGAMAPERGERPDHDVRLRVFSSAITDESFWR
jgi:hypothetical protein